MKGSRTKPDTSVVYLIFSPLEDEQHAAALAKRRARKKAKDRPELARDDVVLYDCTKIFSYATGRERYYELVLTQEELDELRALCTTLFEGPTMMLIEPETT